ncbi:unannotated protein [freshwater metagenome]|uniref:Unannotated protein n=1 Tax=freshwater metagenome TaxID=449393 RepID=A0A6J6BTB8_9ZZZZ
MIEVAGSSKDHVLGQVTTLVITVHDAAGHIRDGFQRTDDGTTDRGIPQQRTGEFIVNQVRRIVVAHGHFLKHDIAFAINISGTHQR